MSLTSDNVKLIRASDMSGYQFDINPHIEPHFEHLQVPHQLDSGLTISYDKKFKVNFTLTWQEPNFFRSEQLEELRVIKNSLEGLCIYPSPEYHPDSVYAVRWANGFEFKFVKGNVYMGYEGRIELEGMTILSEIDADYVMTDILPS